jgi:dihydrofolate reductase/thymidylate synthase
MKRFKELTTSLTGNAGGATASGHQGSSQHAAAVAAKRNAVIMGRKTWESIPPKFRPLPNRWNVVLTTDPAAVASSQGSSVAIDQGTVRVESDLERAVDALQCDEKVDKIFVIGGGQVYQQALKLGLVNRIYYTEVANLPSGDSSSNKFDAYFPELDAEVWRKVEPAEVEINSNKENGSDAVYRLTEDGFRADPASGLHYRFVEYRRRNTEEIQYLDLCRDVMENGIRRGDRTGTGTLSKFGTQMRFSLRNGRLPLLTTKRTFWRGVAEELLWFISVRKSGFVPPQQSSRTEWFLTPPSPLFVCQGCTNANVLAEKDIHIWDGNGSREFLDQRGLSHREVGDLGPVYGFQWRHFGAAYVDMHTDYSGQGVDQLRDCIDKIKNHPEDRRIIMSAWNPADLDLMALPPCHMFCQFYVRS